MIKKILIVIVVLILLGIVFLGSQIEFKISDEEARDVLSESANEIHFNDVKIQERTIHYAYTDNNKDLLIVFVHGSPGSWNAFIDYFKADSLLGYMDMVSFDRAGFGGSDFGDAEPSLEIQAKHLKAVTDQFDHKNKILIDHSSFSISGSTEGATMI
ncbi:MAG: alpha/beta hydrolase, partial [Bacteroidota bacterium]